jgi:hypothetical protein
MDWLLGRHGSIKITRRQTTPLTQPDLKHQRPQLAPVLLCINTHKSMILPLGMNDGMWRQSRMQYCES